QLPPARAAAFFVCTREERLDPYRIVFVRPRAQDLRAVRDQTPLQPREDGIERPLGAFRGKEVATDGPIALELDLPTRMLRRGVTDAAPTTAHDESGGPPVLIRLRPPVLIAIRVAWRRRPHRRVHVGGECGVAGLRGRECELTLRRRVFHQPLRLRRPVRFAYRSAQRNARKPR